MSYKQIIRRAGRILNATVKDAFRSIYDDELDAFDRELENAAAQGGQAEPSRKKEAPRGSSRPTEGGDTRRETRTEGKRKPGEKDTAHYLAVLGLPSDAAIADIRRAYKTRMSRVHPDRVATAPPAEQQRAAERAKEINEAYQILRRRLDFK